MFCGSCGQPLEGQPFCRRCGAAGSGAPPVAPAGRGSVSPVLIGVIATAGVVVVALLAWLILGAVGGSTVTSSTTPVEVETTPSPDTDAATDAAAAPATAPGTSPTATPSTAAGPGDVRALPAGLFCRDLNAKGYSYTAAVEYWRLHGQPNQMDAERNGIPCETVYSADDVTAYWGPRPSADYVYDSGFDSLPAGLLCRDLAAHGLDYDEAVAYWGYWGQPDRMDEDLNGIPCETVYSGDDVSAYWG